MHLAKLIGVLKSFDSSELKQLRKYIQSPLFQVYPPSAELFAYLYTTAPRFASARITVKLIAQNRPALSTLSQQEVAGTRLLQQVYNFIAYTQWQKNEDEKKRYALEGLKALQLHDEYDRQFEKQMDLLNQNEQQNFDTFYQKHLLTELDMNGFAAKLKRNAGNNIMPVIETLDAFYALKKLRYLCEAVNRKVGFGANYQAENVPLLLKILEPYNSAAFPYPYLTINVYRMITADIYEDSKLYYELIKQFASLNEPTPAIREAVTYAINYTLIWHNKGNVDASREYLWWIEWKLKHGLMLENGQLIPVAFRNISTAALNLKNPEQMKGVIEKYGKYLPPQHYEANLAFANGLYYYGIKQYREAIRNFLAAEPKDEPVFNCNIRRWHWVCAYEFNRNDVDDLLNQLTAFDKFLQRNKQQLAQFYQNFESFISYSLKLVKTVNAEELYQTGKNLDEEDFFTGKYWLVEQYDTKNKKARTKARAPVS